MAAWPNCARRAPTSCIKIPDGVSFADAAALPVAYGTALRMMVTNGHVAKGEKVLILGASGGVGVCCLQLAKLAGLRGHRLRRHRCQGAGAWRNSAPTRRSTTSRRIS